MYVRVWCGSSIEQPRVKNISGGPPMNLRDWNLCTALDRTISFYRIYYYLVRPNSTGTDMSLGSQGGY